MATAQQLEEMVVRLTGDASEYQRMLKTAQTQTSVTADEIQKAMGRAEAVTRSVETATEKYARQTKDLQILASKGAISQGTYSRAMKVYNAELDAATPKSKGFFKSVEEGGKSVLGTFAAIGISVGLWKSFEKFEAQERTMLRLNAAISSHGGNVAKLGVEYKKFAEEIADTTLVTKIQVFSMLQQAEAMGLTDERAKQATKNAIGLAAAKGGEAESYLRLGIAVEHGYIPRMLAMSAGLKDVENDSERLRMTQEFLAKGMDIARAEANLTTGQLQRMEKELGAVTKEVGKVVAGGIKPLILALTESVRWFLKLDPTIRSIVVHTLAFTATLVVFANTIPKVIAYVKAAQASIMAFGSAVLSSPLTWYVAGLAAITVALVVLGNQLVNRSGDVDRLNREVERAVSLQDEWNKQQQKATGGVVAKAGAIGDPNERRKFLEDQLRLENLNLKGRESAVGEVTKRHKENSGILDSVGRSVLGWTGAWKEISAAERQEVEAANQGLQTQKERIAAIQAELEKLSQKHLTQQADELLGKLKLQQQTVGMTAEEAERFKLAVDGLRPEKLTEIDRAIMSGKLAKDIDEVTKALTEESKAQEELSKGRKAWDRVLELQKRGAGMGQLEAARAAAAQIVDNEKLAESQKRVKAQTERVVELTKQYLTPQQKLAETQRDLDVLFAEAGLSVDVYNAAMEDAVKQTQNLREETQSLTSSLYGSADAVAKVAAFRERMTQGRGVTGFTPKLPLTPVGVQLPPGFGGANLVDDLFDQQRQAEEKRKAAGPRLPPGFGAPPIDPLLGPLVDIRELLRKQAAKPAVELEAADLA